MARVSLDLFKKHTRTTSFARDDEYLQDLLNAAETFVINLTGYTAEEWSVVPDKAFPKDLCHVIMVVGADMYAEREMTVPGTYQLRPFLLGMVKPYQKMRGGSLAEKLIAKYSESSEG